MKWAFGIRRKISAALLLASVFVLVFVKNLVDNKHVTQLGVSFSSVYEDRLMAESYIYRLSEHLFRKKMMIDSSVSPAATEEIKPVMRQHNAGIDRIIAQYDQTKLTDEEARFFVAFKKNIRVLTALEEEYYTRVAAGEDFLAQRNLINSEFNKASNNLRCLSTIQISEGKILNDHSKKIVAGSSLLTQFEMGILVTIGLMIIVLVCESSAVFTKPGQKQSLN